MEVLTKEEFEGKTWHWYNQIKSDALFIYPTDTIYGIGCNATSEEAVKKLRSVKTRYTRPFSIIAPNKQWILKNCVIGEKEKLWVDKLPGPYTLILKLKNKTAIAKETNNDMNTMGVRMPDHWITEHVKKLQFPIITTSANLSGQDYMTALEDLDSEIKHKTDFIIFDGKLTSRPSTLIDLSQNGEKVVER